MPSERAPWPTLTSLAITPMLLGGCLLPYPIVSTSSKPAPDVARYLPSDLRSNNEEVLVLAEFAKQEDSFSARKGTSYQTDLQAFRVRTNELESLGDKVKLESLSTLGTGFLRILPDEGGGAKTDELVTKTEVTLRLLCVVASDARTFRFSPNGDDGYDVRSGTLTQSDRHSFTRGLRENDTFKPSEVRGPCGIKGIPVIDKWGWEQAIDFLVSVSIP